MSDIITLEQVEALAVQLPQAEQVKLVEHIQERLRNRPPAPPPNPEDREKVRQERIVRTEAFLAELDAFVESQEYTGERDAAQLIREVREERLNRL